MQMNAHFMQINEYKKSPIFPVYGIHASWFPLIMKISSLRFNLSWFQALSLYLSLLSQVRLTLFCVEGNSI